MLAVPATWRKYLGDDFPAFATLCLDPHAYEVESYPCPCNCGCWHRVIRTVKERGEGRVERVVGRALYRAFDGQPKHAQLQIPNTIQFASWAADAVPLFLTMQTDR